MAVRKPVTPASVSAAARRGDPTPGSGRGQISHQNSGKNPEKTPGETLEVILEVTLGVALEVFSGVFSEVLTEVLSGTRSAADLRRGSRVRRRPAKRAKPTRHWKIQMRRGKPRWRI